MEMGVRVSLNTHAPLSLPGMLSTAEILVARHAVC